MRELRYLHPSIYADIAGQMLTDANGVALKGQRKRQFTLEVKHGIEAAIALALDVPGVHVNPEPARA